MSDSSLSHYRTNLTSFTLPPALKDRTMHMFALGDSGPSEFSVVMSQADAAPEDTLDSFSERLVNELAQSLPQFALAGTQERAVAGTQAVELQYSWRSNGELLHQRQIVALVAGAQAGTRHALLIGATCVRAFTPACHAALDAILDSMTLRHQAPASPEPAVAADSIVFTLSERRRTLHAYSNHNEACRYTDAREVEQDAWAFFDAAGTPLHPDFIVPNSGTLWRKPGTYVLVERADVAAPSLRERLHQAAVFVAGSPAVPYASLAEVQSHLDRCLEP